MTRYNITAIVKDKRGRPLAVGRNSYVKTHPLQAKAAKKVGAKKQSFLHAEVAAILKVKNWKNAYSIETFRFTKDGKPALAKPCAACQWVIKQTGIRQVFYTGN